jgi:hypothetical protein
MLPRFLPCSACERGYGRKEKLGNERWRRRKRLVDRRDVKEQFPMNRRKSSTDYHILVALYILPVIDLFTRN